MVATFFKLIPNLMPYLGIVFCLMCLFCSLGVHVRSTLPSSTSLLLHHLYVHVNGNSYTEKMMGNDRTGPWLSGAVQLFGGLVYAGNPILASTTMFENEYPSSLSLSNSFLSLHKECSENSLTK
jgi:hypothetical protein